MSSTNQAFINAYQRPRPAAAITGAASPEAVSTAAAPYCDFAASAGFAQVDSFDTTTALSASVEPATATANDDRAAAPAPRRPLSQVQADQLFGFSPRPVEKPSLQWPEVCQRLLARSADGYDTLIRQLPTQSAGVLVGLVGAASGTGGTTTAICLALRSAALGYNACLVDGDLAGSRLASTLGMGRTACWLAAMESGASIMSIAHTAQDVGVDLLLAGNSHEGQLSSTARFRTSLAAGMLRRKYQHIYVDLGSMGADNSDAIADLAAALGVDYLIATSTPHHAHALPAAVAALAQHGLTFSGIVEAA